MTNRQIQILSADRVVLPSQSTISFKLKMHQQHIELVKVQAIRNSGRRRYRKDQISQPLKGIAVY